MVNSLNEQNKRIENMETKVTKLKNKLKEDFKQMN